MPPLTLTILAALLKMHGPDASITSENKGLDAVLGDIRGRVHQQAGMDTASVIPVVLQPKYHKTVYTKQYIKFKKK